MIRFACPTCHKIIKAPDEGADRKFPCPRCGQLLVVPASLHQKNNPVLGLLLPESDTSPANTKPPVPIRESPLSNLGTPSATPTLENEPPTENFSDSNEPPPARLGLPVQEPAPATSSRWSVGSTFAQPDSIEQPPELKHSIVGITTTIGACVMFIVIFIFMLFCQSQADKIGSTPGVNFALAQKRLNTMNTIALIIGISSVVTSAFWIALSFRSQTKKHWIVVACVANGFLLIWILLNPMGVAIPPSKTALGKPAPSKAIPKRDNIALAPHGNDRSPAKAPPQLLREAAPPEIKPEPPQAAPQDIVAPRQERKLIEEEEEPKSTKLKKGAIKQEQEIGSESQRKEEEVADSENRPEEKVAQLIKNLTNRNPLERIKAAEGLGDMGPDADTAREGLCIAMTDARTAVRNAAASALAKVDPGLQKPVLTLIVDKELGNRLQALRALAALGERGKPARSIVLAFANLIHGSSGFVGSNNAVLVIETLMAIAPHDKRVFTLLSSCLTSEDISQGYILSTKLAAARALPRTAFRKEAVKVLVNVFRSESNDRMREAAAQSLGDIGPDAKDAVKVLEPARIDPSVNVREAAAAALKKIKGD